MRSVFSHKTLLSISDTRSCACMSEMHAELSMHNGSCVLGIAESLHPAEIKAQTKNFLDLVHRFCNHQ